MPTKGTPMPLEVRRKISATKRANPYVYTDEVRAKMSGKAKGPKPSRIKGQRIQDGYILVYQPNHLRADCRGYVKRAILVLEAKIGRSLLPGEMAHHRNRVCDDDSPDNLRLFGGRSGHTKFHVAQGDLPKPPKGKGNISNLVPFRKGFDPRRSQKVKIQYYCQSCGILICPHPSRVKRGQGKYCRSCYLKELAGGKMVKAKRNFGK